MIADFDFTQVLFILGGATGIIGGILAFVKFLGKSATGTFTIEAAKGVTVMQSQFIDTLQGDYDRVSKENRQLNVRVQSLEDQVRSFGRMHERIETLGRDKLELEKRVAHLEQENEELKAQLGKVTGG